MRIAVDLQACQNTSRGRGIARYAMALTRALCRAGRGHSFTALLNAAFPGTIAPIRRDLEGYVRQEDVHVMAFAAETACAYPANGWRTRAAERLRAEMLDAMAPDLVFVPSLFEGYHDATVVSVEPGRHVTAVTLFDFIPADHPEVYLPGADIRAAYARRLRQASAADLLLPISEFVGGQARARLGVPAERIVPVPLGVEPHFRPLALAPDARRALLARHGIARPFVLNASPFEFRKNLEGLIAGYGALPGAVRDAHQLVIVGRMSPSETQRLRELARAAGLAEGALVLAGYVPDEDLVALYGACELFVFPSLSEGFGLPVLEAMACGAAVIGSDATSIPEVIGRADMLFPPRDPQAMAARMTRVLTDPEVRAELGRAGVARAAPFTWERTAERTLDAFEAAVVRRRLGDPALREAEPVEVVRPTLALVADDPRGTSGRGYARVIAALEAEFEVTRVSSAGETGALGLEAFPAAAPGFDGLVYLLGQDDGDPRVLELLESFPGAVLLRRRGRACPPDRKESLRDVFGAGGWPALLAACAGDSVGALAADARVRRIGAAATAVFEWPSSNEGWARLAADLGEAQGGTHGRLRAFAARLPARVRNRAPDAADLARLAEAWVRAEAAHRRSRAWLDVSGLARRERLDSGDEPLLRALLGAGGPDLRCLAADRDGRYLSADSRMSELLDAGGGAALPGTPVAPRPGDWLLACERWGGLDAEAARPFLEAGAGYVRVTSGERDLAPAARSLFARLANLEVDVRGGELELVPGEGLQPGESAAAPAREAAEASWIARL